MPAPGPSSAPPRTPGLTEAEAARAAELEQQVLASERQADAARVRAKERAVREPFSGGSPLAVRAEQEYAYVARDMKQIAEMAVLMLAILFGLWFLIDIAKVISIA
jgi:multidrug efflux pump subunit AcrA (membrane-fusion protein)